MTLWRAKIRASGVHLAISAALFVAIVAVAVGSWYPPPFFWIDGGLQITLLAASVDLVLGPLLTFVVFRPGKRGLVMNLALIAALQAGALAWGVRALYAERPVMAAFVGYPQNRFFPVTERQLSEGARSIEELRALSDQRPPLVFIDLPADESESRRILMSALQGESSVLRQTERYRRIEGDALARINAGSRKREAYAYDNPGFAQEIDAFAASQGARIEDYAIIPVYGRFGRALVALERKDGKLAGVVAKEVRLR